MSSSSSKVRTVLTPDPAQESDRSSPYARQKSEKKSPLISTGYLIDNEALDILTNSITSSRSSSKLSSGFSSPSLFRKKKKLTTDGITTDFHNSGFHLNPNTITSTPPPPPPIPINSRVIPGSSPHGRKQKNFLAETCIFCEEPLKLLLLERNSLENIVELECGHTCHEECLAIAMDFDKEDSKPAGTILEEEEETFALKRRPMLNQSDMPRCKCGHIALPLDGVLLEKMLSHKILPAPPVPPSIRLEVSPQKKESTSPKSKFVTKLASPMKSKSAHSRKHSRGSSISAISSIISSVSNSRTPSPTAKTFFPTKSTYSVAPSTIGNGSLLNAKIPSALMRSKILSNLIQDCSSVGGKLTELSESFIDSLGLLRLADRFNSCILSGQRSHSKSTLYLFSYALLIVNEKDKDYVVIPLVQNQNSRFSLLAVDVNLKIVSTSSFEVNASGVTCTCFSQSDALIQKWITAFENPEMLFPNERLTDNINLSSVPFLPNIDPNTSVNRLLYSEFFVERTGPPKTVILVVNQYMITGHALSILRNIVKAFKLIEVHVLMIFCSEEGLSASSSVLFSKRFDHTTEEEDDDHFWENVDVNNWSDSKQMLSQIIDHALKTHHYKFNEYGFVVLSNLKLGDITKTLTKSECWYSFAEIGLVNNENEAREEHVSKLASWDDVMEKLCTDFGLDFDSIYTSDVGNDTDATSLATKSSKMQLHDNSSSHSVTTESDSDEDVITNAIAEYEHDKDEQSMDNESDLSKTPLINQLDNEFIDTPIAHVDVSPLTPRINHNYQLPTASTNSATNSAVRLSSIISDIDRALAATAGYNDI